jgi:hypothetical protein
MLQVGATEDEEEEEELKTRRLKIHSTYYFR